MLGEVIEPAALALGSESKQVLGLRRRRAAIRLLGGDYRAALPEFAALAARTPASPDPPASRPAPAAPRQPGAAPNPARAPTRWPHSRGC
ncbi:hypothetical protein [Streptomyces sp. NPDC005283]|uniref:hypothetical protein n=1 Tax=Streptomyces sp. NPDC005283 TaxID=3156871 RepID=UPI003453D244